MARQIRPGQLQENVLYNISASFAISASHEITHEVSSSYAESASFAVTASHLLNNPPAFPFNGDAVITGSLRISGSANQLLAIGKNNSEYFTIGADAGNRTTLTIPALPFVDPDAYQISYQGDSDTTAQLFMGASIVEIGDVEGTSGKDTKLTINADPGQGDVGFTFNNYPVIIQNSITASGNVSGSATSTSSFGTYIGDGSGLTNIPASGITGLNLSRIASGSVTASISPDNGLQINTDTQITGSLIVSGSNNRIDGSTVIFSTGTPGLTVQSNSDTAEEVKIYDAKIDIEDSGYMAARLSSNSYGSRIGILDLRHWAGNNGAVITASPNKTSYIQSSLLIGKTGTVNSSYAYKLDVNGDIKLGNGTDDSIEILGPVTASSNISSSGTIVASNLSGTNTGDQDLSSFITNSQTASMSVLSSSFAVTASHALNAGASATNFTQSLFVTPTGDNSTATVGDMLKPFQTILAATASANPGDTIIVYPGEYITGAQIAKDNINYYFYPGAVVSGSTSLVAGTFENLNIRGHGIFKTNYNGAPVGSIVANGYFECDRVEFAGLQSSGYAGSPSFAQNVSADPNGVLQLKGDYKYGLIDGARTGNSFNAAMRFGAGNIIANCNAFVSSSTNMTGIDIATSTTTDVTFNGDVFSLNGRAVYTNDRASHVTLNGRFETGDQATYEAIYIVPAYIGRYIVNGEIIGSIRIDTGETSDSGVQIDGFQLCSSSPNSCAVKIDGGYNTLNHTIRASEIIFDVNGGETHFYGAAYVSSNSTGKLFDVSAGKFVWNGMNTGTNVRALSNVISGGELVINGPLEHYGSGYPNNVECFALTGGTLEINNKVRYHQNTTGSGIIDMSGGYLKLNGAELVHNDGTGSYAYCVKLNAGSHSGSILNNSFTNLNAFGPGSFTNEIVGGGTLFYSDKLY